MVPYTLHRLLFSKSSATQTCRWCKRARTRRHSGLLSSKTLRFGLHPTLTSSLLKRKQLFRLLSPPQLQSTNKTTMDSKVASSSWLQKAKTNFVSVVNCQTHRQIAPIKTLSKHQLFLTRDQTKTIAPKCQSSPRTTQFLVKWHSLI